MLENKNLDIYSAHYVTSATIHDRVAAILANESHSAFCRRTGTLTPHLSAFLSGQYSNGRGGVPKTILEFFGLERVIVYRPKATQL